METMYYLKPSLCISNQLSHSKALKGAAHRRRRADPLKRRLGRPRSHEGELPNANRILSVKTGFILNPKQQGMNTYGG